MSGGCKEYGWTIFGAGGDLSNEPTSLLFFELTLLLVGNSDRCEPLTKLEVDCVRSVGEYNPCLVCNASENLCFDLELVDFGNILEEVSEVPGGGIDDAFFDE